MTARLYSWPRHMRARCPEGTDDWRCTSGQCVHLNLFACTVCGGAEGDLPSDCPGERMEPGVRQSVFDGELNYLRTRGWVRAGDFHFQRSW